MGKEDHEFYFLCEGNDGECAAEALWECQEETITYCDDCFSNEHKGRRKSHSKMSLARKRLKGGLREDVNVLDQAVYGEMRREIVVADEDNRWMQIAADNWIHFRQEARDEYCPVISFIGSTGTGKSFLVRSFTGEDQGPRVAPTNQKSSTSANINLFHAPGYDTQKFSFRRLIMLDCEGDGGTVPEMLRQRWLPLQKMSKKLNLSLSANRTHIVREEFPRMAYLTSDVIIFLETVDFTRIQDYLAKFQKFINATQKGVLSASTPSLLIVQNKVDPVAVNNRMSVSEATEDFMNLAFPFAKEEKPTRRRKKRRSTAVSEEDLTSYNVPSAIPPSVVLSQSDSTSSLPEITRNAKSTDISEAEGKSSGLRVVQSEDFVTSDGSRKKERKSSKKSKSSKSSKSSKKSKSKSKSKDKSKSRSDSVGKEEERQKESEKEDTQSPVNGEEDSQKKSDSRKLSSPGGGREEVAPSVPLVVDLADAAGSESKATKQSFGKRLKLSVDSRKQSLESKAPSSPNSGARSSSSSHGGGGHGGGRSAKKIIDLGKQGVNTLGTGVRAGADIVGAGVGGVAGKVTLAGAEIGRGVDRVKGIAGAEFGKVMIPLRDNVELTEEEREKDDKRRRKEFVNSFDMISCVRIPNYRYVGSIEPYLKAFRDEVKKMVNHHASLRFANGTNYSEGIWLDIVKELVQSCTSLTDEEQVGIRMAQVVGKVLQPANGEELINSIYCFFEALYIEKNTEGFVSTRKATEEYLAVILATRLRKTGTKVSLEKIKEQQEEGGAPHPFLEMCATMFHAAEKALSQLRPCEVLHNKKDQCTQLEKDHGELHRFPGGKKKAGELLYNEPEGFSQKERSDAFTARVARYLNRFHRDPRKSVETRIRHLSGHVSDISESQVHSLACRIESCLLCFTHPSGVLLKCRHSFCEHCMKDVQELSKSLPCPLCGTELGVVVDRYKIPGKAGYRILSLDGGGIKGIIELVVLRRLLTMLGPGVQAYHLFDLIVGTSTGAIVGVALGICKKDIHNAIQMYMEFPKRVFKKNVVINHSVLKVAYLLMGGNHLYKIATLQDLLREQVDMECDFVETMADPTVPKVALVSTNYTANPMRPVLFCNYIGENVSSAQLKDVETVSTCKIYEGMTASAAAPVFFAPYRIGDTLYVDGALSANNPTELAINEALRLWPERKPDYVLSLGTGKAPTASVSDSLFSWASTLTAKATDPDAIHQREKLHFKRKRADSLTGEKRYFRVNPPDISVEMDSVKQASMETVIEQTEAYLDEKHIHAKLLVIVRQMKGKSFYIGSEVEFTPVPPERVKATLRVECRLPIAAEQSFVYEYRPLAGSDPVERTYEERDEESNTTLASFLAPAGSSYVCHVHVLFNKTEAPISVAGSPFTVTFPKARVA